MEMFPKLKERPRANEQIRLLRSTAYSTQETSSAIALLQLAEPKPLARPVSSSRSTGLVRPPSSGSGIKAYDGGANSSPDAYDPQVYTLTFHAPWYTGPSEEPATSITAIDTAGYFHDVAGGGAIEDDGALLRARLNVLVQATTLLNLDIILHLPILTGETWQDVCAALVFIDAAIPQFQLAVSVQLNYPVISHPVLPSTGNIEARFRILRALLSMEEHRGWTFRLGYDRERLFLRQPNMEVYTFSEVPSSSSL